MRKERNVSWIYMTTKLFPQTPTICHHLPSAFGYQFTASETGCYEVQAQPRDLKCVLPENLFL